MDWAVLPRFAPRENAIVPEDCGDSTWADSHLCTTAAVVPVNGFNHARLAVFGGFVHPLNPKANMVQPRNEPSSPNRNA